MVSNVGAYVDGRPTPFSSKVRINVASLKRAGGWVKCCFGSISTDLTTSPSTNSGKIFSLSSLPSSRPSTYTCINPLNFTLEPLAINVTPFCWSVTFMVSKIAGVIWLATKRDQIRVYNFNWSLSKYFFISSGVLKTLDGRTASWASCAQNSSP